VIAPTLGTQHLRQSAMYVGKIVHHNAQIIHPLRAYGAAPLHGITKTMHMKKTAIVILSDPKSGSEEALGRVFNALAAAYDFKAEGEDVKIVFQGTATRWPEQLQKPEHPVHKLFLAVHDKIAGVSKECADVFGAAPSGFDLVSENQVPVTAGLPSFVKLKNDGYNVLIF
jgi:hypothetical protein